MMDGSSDMTELEQQRKISKYWYEQYTRLKTQIRNATLLIEMTDLTSPNYCPWTENHRKIRVCTVCGFNSLNGNT
jgi:hypothetical protein